MPCSILLKVTVLKCTEDQVKKSLSSIRHPPTLLQSWQSPDVTNRTLNPACIWTDGSRPYYHLARLASVFCLYLGNASWKNLLTCKDRSEGLSLRTLWWALVNKTRNTQTNPLQLTDQLLKTVKGDHGELAVAHPMTLSQSRGSEHV